MDAVQMQVSAQATNKFHKIVKVDTDLCIGCGVCVHKCPTDSIILERREEITEPPKDGRELMQLNLADRQAAKEQQTPNT
jgi:formate hydrogenlyase subunit 6/NADH:ubiquinone oxidoreductase subunit I